MDIFDISNRLELEYRQSEAKKNKEWKNSPFQWLLGKPSRQVGAIGEKLVSAWAESQGLKVLRTQDAEADRVINGHRVEIKLSTRWSQNGIYKFQQIRDQKYDYLFCLGLSPLEAHAWFIPKVIAMDTNYPEIQSQHGGKRGRDTKWLSFKADAPPSWLAAYGGSLERVRDLIIRGDSS